jgi:hypothetical protein
MKPTTTKPSSVGTATMTADGTLVMDLRSPSGAEMQQRVAPSDAKYSEYVAHLGGIKAGESKNIPPWPDNIDDEQVNALARKFLVADGWSAGDVQLSITGTDAQGRVAVSAWNGDRSRRAALRVDQATGAVTTVPTP